MEIRAPSPFPPSLPMLLLLFIGGRCGKLFKYIYLFFPDVLPYVLIQLFHVPGALKIRFLHESVFQIIRRIRA